MEDLRARFLEGMSRAATFVAVATTDGPAGRFGVTISSLTSVSADGDQPSLLACIHHLSPAAGAILKNRSFCANLLHEGQEAMANLFAGRGGDGHDNRFDRAGWTPGPLGQPQITGATAVFECRLATALLWETHHIIVGRVVGITLSEDPAALLYGQRAYRRAVHLPKEN
ncbi:flavin reductase family protein [Gemmobacter serpentinus]|uniref:flavin reductase family protein n=1 Tax=Gemmobacter serpentinus TaxID=2652247 RepID=UPI00124DEA0C|nr:flavin reductase family protein [Gemmobacter serpentinus]